MSDGRGRPARALVRLASGVLAGAACRSPDEPPPAPASIGGALGADLFIGTDGVGRASPAARVPWGLVAIGPQSDARFGYRHSDHAITGFGHLNVNGSPADFGVIRVLPLAPGDRRVPDALQYSKAWELAVPGVYAVGLRGAGVAAEMCASPRASLSRYRRREPGTREVLVDAGGSIGPYGNTTTSSELAPDAYGFGGAVTAGFMGGLGRQPRIYFHVAFDGRPSRVKWLADGVRAQPPRDWRAARLGGLHVDATRWRTVAQAHARGWRRVAARVVFDDPRDEVRIRVGVSPTSVEAARRNAEAELPSFDFAACARGAQDAWQHVLDGVGVATPNGALATTVRTAVYRMMLHPSRWSDLPAATAASAETARMRFDTGGTVTVLSLWDTWRTLDPLMSLIAPERERATLRTLVARADARRALPMWEMFGEETSNMVGDPAAVVLASGALQDLVDDPRHVLALLVRNAETTSGWPAATTDTKGRLGGEEYRRRGYVPEPLVAPRLSLMRRLAARVAGVSTLSLSQAHVYGSVATTLEYMYADHCVARLAEHLGDTAVARRAALRSTAWQTLLDTGVRDTLAGVVARGFFRPRLASGAWLSPFAPSRGGGEQQGFVEGGAWQYRYFVPHAPFALAQALGGVTLTRASLRAYFDAGYVTLANEPDFHLPWYLLTLGQGAALDAGDQRRVVRAALRAFVGPPPRLPGDDDAGALSAWVVWTAIGLYPLSPCDGTFTIGRPLVDRADLRLGTGPDSPHLSIQADGAADTTRVVRRVRWNGRVLTAQALSARELRRGGQLVFELVDGNSTATSRPSP